MRQSTIEAKPKSISPFSLNDAYISPFIWFAKTQLLNFAIAVGSVGLSASGAAYTLLVRDRVNIAVSAPDKLLVRPWSVTTLPPLQPSLWASSAVMRETDNQVTRLNFIDTCISP